MHRLGSVPAILVTLSWLAAAMPAAGGDPASGQAPAARPSAADPAARPSGEGADAHRAAIQELLQKQKAKRLEHWDANGNGKLDPEELAAEKAALKKSVQASRQRNAAADAERKARLEKYDRDGDGRLSDEERAGMRSDLEAGRAAGQNAKGGASH